MAEDLAGRVMPPHRSLGIADVYRPDWALDSLCPMQVMTVREALATDPGHGGVEVRGWVRTVRESKAGMAFVSLHDGSAFKPLQVVVPSDMAGYDEAVSRLTPGCSLRATGELVESRGKGQTVELRAEEIEVVGVVDDPKAYPIQPKRHTFEFLRTVPHLRVRTNTFGAVARLRHRVSMAIHRFFHERDFMWVHTPIVTTNDAEGAGSLFRASTLDMQRIASGAPLDFKEDFFGAETFLTVSGQLNVEAYCCALSRVYTFSPCFRAENSNTARHLAEFWMIEPEVAFLDLEGNVHLAEDFMKYIFRAVLEECPDEMAFFDQHIQEGVTQRIEDFLAKPIEFMDYTEAVRILEEAVAAGHKFEFPCNWGVDLQSEHEKFLTEHVGGPLAVINYPKDIKAFYTRVNDDDRTVAAMDILAPGVGEIVGGTVREERLDVFDRRMNETGVDPDSLFWYRDLRRYGTVPHAGFGAGLERFLMYISGISNIRDVIPFPRTPGTAFG